MIVHASTVRPFGPIGYLYPEDAAARSNVLRIVLYSAAFVANSRRRGIDFKKVRGFTGARDRTEAVRRRTALRMMQAVDAGV
jgi:hypothetical protein